MSTTALIAVSGYSRSGSGRGPGLELLHVTSASAPAATGSGATAPAAAGQEGEGFSVERRARVDLPDPSFVLWSRDGSLLYAVLETSPTQVVAVHVGADGHSAEIAATLTLEGSGGCHLAHGRTPGTLLVADYGSGTVETVRLDADSLPAEVIDVDDHHDRADGHDPHPHQTTALPGTEMLAVPDLGLDRVFLYRQDPAGQMGLAGEIPLSRGSGPRHLAPDHESEQLHISCELSGMVATAARRPVESSATAPTALNGTAHSWSVRSMIPASGRGGDNAVSHLELTADEGLLVVANRGPDTISLLSLTMMRPQIVAEIEVGAHPRHFTLLDDLILVAAQESDRIDVLRRQDEELTVAAAPIPAPSVSCLAVRP